MSSWMIGLGVFVALNMIAFYQSYRAYRNLNPDVPNAAGLFLRRGSFAGRELFTTEGWKYRNRAVALHVVSVLVWMGFVFL